MQIFLLESVLRNTFCLEQQHSFMKQCLCINSDIFMCVFFPFFGPSQLLLYDPSLDQGQASNLENTGLDNSLTLQLTGSVICDSVPLFSKFSPSSLFS